MLSAAGHSACPRRVRQPAPACATLSTCAAVSLAELVRRHHLADHLDVLLIDTEGFDFHVVRQIPLAGVRPRCVAGMLNAGASVAAVCGCCCVAVAAPAGPSAACRPLLPKPLIAAADAPAAHDPRELLQAGVLGALAPEPRAAAELMRSHCYAVWELNWENSAALALFT